MDDDIFARLESNVRSYARLFPVTFVTANGPWLIARNGVRYLDLLSGAGSLNYGHNNSVIINRVIDYLKTGGIVHSLDLQTAAKEEFMRTFDAFVLAPRGLPYKMQFPAPTGSDAVEASLKLARKVSGRSLVMAFKGGYHGMTLGSLAVTSNARGRRAAGVPLQHVEFLPFDEHDEPDVTALTLLSQRASETLPAAVIVELVQGEGGLNVATTGWFRGLSDICRERGILLIVDDVQAGCGRTGTFFSFDGTGVTPDIVVLSKSLSGFGTPLSLVLLRPDLDQWEPAEHTGTFRGNNLGFVGASAAIAAYWSNSALEEVVAARSAVLREQLSVAIEGCRGGRIKGRGLFVGVAFDDGPFAREVSRRLFEKGVVAETCGPGGNTLKLLPPLTIGEEDLDFAIHRIREAIYELKNGD